jgi:hypothetical protein
MGTTKKIIAGAAAAAATGIAAAAARHMMKPGVVDHVAAVGDEGTLLAEGAKRATSRHATKKDAIAAGRELANAKKPSRLIIHKSDGSVQREHEYVPA